MKVKMREQRLVIGLTGGFGTGKTTVARIFRSFGARIIDADRIAHRVIRPGTPAYRKILRIFGRDIVKKSRHINRAALARITFGDKTLLVRLNRIVHPPVIREIKKEIRGSAAKEIILDVPLLVEAGLTKLADKIIVVRLNRKKQISRLQKRTSLRRADIIGRIKAQASLSDKLRLADFVIDNNGRVSETLNQIKAIRRRLWKN